MKKILNLIVLSLILVFSISQNLFPKVSWVKSFDSTIKKSESTGLPIMIYVYSDSCDWCDKLEKIIFKDKEISKNIKKNFISYRLNPKEINEGNDILKQYGVVAYPTIFFINKDKLLLRMHSGYIDKNDFLELSKEVLLENQKVNEALSDDEPTLEKLNIYIRSNKEKEAKYIYDFLIKNNKIPESEIPSYILGFALLKAQNENFEEATLEFNSIINEYPNSEEVYVSYYYIAVIMSLRNEQSEAIKYLENILSEKNSIPENFRSEYQDLLEYIKSNLN